MANILQTAYQLIDTFWVGRLGAEAIAAVSLSFPIIFLMISLGGGISIAAAVLVAQYKGKGDQETIDRVSGQGVLMMVTISIILSAIGYLMSAPLMRMMGAEADVLPGAIAYLKFSFIGFTFVYGFFVFQSLLRGVGVVKTPMFIVLGTVILNLILDPLFIFGYGFIPAYGVAGAALATIGTQGIAALIGLLMLCSGKYDVRLRLRYLKLDKGLLKRIFFLGLPSSAEQASRSLCLTFLAVLVASFGTKVIASYGIGTRALAFIIIPAVGISMATSTVVGQNMGAGKIERAEKAARVSVVLSFIVLTLAGALLFIFARQIAGFFIPGDIAVIGSSTLFIRIMALTFGFMGAQEVVNGVLRGSGNTLHAMVLAIISLWFIRFPLAYVLSKHTILIEKGIWWAFPISNILSALIAFGWFLKGSWKEKRLTEKTMIQDEVLVETIADDTMQ